jgi:hypothetical protein
MSTRLQAWRSACCIDENGQELSMPPANAASNDPFPNQPIRRFDVFAEYTRQERREKGVPEDQATGYGIWLAKVVASRRFGQQSSSDGANPSTKDGAKRSPGSARWGTRCKRTRPSPTTSSSGRGRDSTRRSSCRRSRQPGRGQNGRDDPRHDPPRVESRPRTIAVTRRIDLR